ncbi:MAG: 30S ribosomal protein S8 [archaeon]|nr:MAG: 30S ribosomal protein S8 [archaeon]
MVVKDWVSSVLNDLMNCKKAGKMETSVPVSSKLLLNILKIMKKEGYIKEIKTEKEKFDRIKISIGKLNECQAIKPRFFVKKNEFEKYIRRFLPARDVGIIIVSTSKGLMTHHEAIEKGLGGSLVAYCF